MKRTVTPKFDMKNGTTVVMDPVTWEATLIQGDIKTEDIENCEISQTRGIARDGTEICLDGCVRTSIKLSAVRFNIADVQKFDFNVPVDLEVTTDGKTTTYKNLMVSWYKQDVPGSFVESIALCN